MRLMTTQVILVRVLAVFSHRIATATSDPATLLRVSVWLLRIVGGLRGCRWARWSGGRCPLSPHTYANAPSPTTWSRLSHLATPRLLRERGKITISYVPFASVLALLVIAVIYLTSSRTKPLHLLPFRLGHPMSSPAPARAHVPIRDTRLVGVQVPPTPGSPVTCRFVLTSSPLLTNPRLDRLGSFDPLGVPVPLICFRSRSLGLGLLPSSLAALRAAPVRLPSDSRPSLAPLQFSVCARILPARAVRKLPARHFLFVLSSRFLLCLSASAGRRPSGPLSQHCLRHPGSSLALVPPMARSSPSGRQPT